MKVEVFLINDEPINGMVFQASGITNFDKPIPVYRNNEKIATGRLNITDNGIFFAGEIPDEHANLALVPYFRTMNVKIEGEIHIHTKYEVIQVILEKPTSMYKPISEVNRLKEHKVLTYEWEHEGQKRSVSGGKTEEGYILIFKRPVGKYPHQANSTVRVVTEGDQIKTMLTLSSEAMQGLLMLLNDARLKDLNNE